MKKLHALLAVLLGVSFLAASAPKNSSNDTVDWTKAEEAYKANLKSENNGVAASAAGFIRKYKLTGAVEELKTLLTKDNADNVKMAAALSLVSIGGTEGRTAVENAMKKEETEIVTEFYRSILHTSETTEQ